MRENFLHFLWRTRRFDAQNLQTTDGQPLEILQPGEQNTHAGPDFFNARIRIGDTLWAGNVEIHLKSSDWSIHRHDTDPAYESVVLHVVLEEDQPILRANGTRIPCLELHQRVPSTLLENYQRLEHEQAWIPCQNFWNHVPLVIRLNWFDRLLIERIEHKTLAVAALLQSTQNHWEEAFYQALARNFGLKINADPFEAVARSLPLKILARHKPNLAQVEALLFGQAGFLESPLQDEWPKMLAREYTFLKRKYELIPIAVRQWKFLRLRPANFPTLRLAQFAALVHHSAQLFSKILEAQNLRSIENLFDVQPSPYWREHFLFDKLSAKREKNLGRDFVHLIVINTIVPFLFHYGKMKSDEMYQRRALSLLEEIRPETNAILQAWAELGTSARNAYQSQSLIHLKTRYCDAKRCLDCAIGAAILK